MNASQQRQDYDMATLLLDAASSTELSNVIRRINDRHTVLVSERESLEKAEALKAALQIKLKEVQRLYRSARADLLKAQRRSHGYELEYYHLQEEHEKIKEQEEQTHSETAKLQAQTKECVAEWEQQLQQVFSRHQIEHELYTNFLQSKIALVEKGRELKQAQNQKLMQLIDDCFASQQSATHEIACLEKEVAELTEREELDNDEVHKLAQQVRAALATVCSYFVLGMTAIAV